MVDGLTFLVNVGEYYTSPMDAMAYMTTNPNFMDSIWLREIPQIYHTFMGNLLIPVRPMDLW